MPTPKARYIQLVNFGHPWFIAPGKAEPHAVGRPSHHDQRTTRRLTAHRFTRNYFDDAVPSYYRSTGELLCNWNIDNLIVCQALATVIAIVDSSAGR